MERIIGERASERNVIDEIKREYGIAVLHEDSDDSIVFGIQDGTVQNNDAQDSAVRSVLRISPRAAALRRNPAAVGTRRVPCMADIERIEMGLVSEAVIRDPRREMNFTEKLMSGALAYQNRTQVPLCLVEAGNTESGDDFFRHFGFQYICDRPHYELNTETLSAEMLERAARGETVFVEDSNIALRVVEQGELLSLAHFVNARLCRQYGFFAIRSAAYYERFQKKLQSGGGNLFQIVECGVRKGCFAYADGQDSCISEVIFDKVSERERYLITGEDQKPAVMARIINLSEMLKHISGNGKITIAIRIKDPAIAENDGLFIWYIDTEGSRMERVKQPEDELEKEADSSMRPEVSTTIGEFTAFIFDYIKLKQNAKFDSIYLAGPAWINEKY